MSAAPLIRELREAGIVLTAIGDRLHVEAPVGTFTPELRRRIVENKPGLLAELTMRSESAAVVELRVHLLALADRYRIAPAHVHRLLDLEVAASAGLDDAQLVTYLKLLDDTATRWAGRRPAGHDAAIFCHGCGPVWVHPGMATALPVVAGWPRALGCPWCVVRKACVAFSRPSVRCGSCELFRPDVINPGAGMGQCACGKGRNYPTHGHACESFQPSNQPTRQQPAPGDL